MNNIKMIKNTNAVINELMNKSHYKPLKTILFVVCILRIAFIAASTQEN
ncbi:hypothetical protein [Campylobacter bilis]